MIRILMSALLTIAVTATAYTWTGHTTRTGTWPEINKTIAVDPRVIPLGSLVHIEDMGLFIAEDTGGLIKGNRIDIYMGSRLEALSFGVKKVNLHIERWGYDDVGAET